MKYRNLFLLMGLFVVPGFAFGACSTANLTRCLDSVCAINIGANAAARCQYCGSSFAGEPSTAGVMKNITAGNAAKYTISDKELKNAPKTANDRYNWAIERCLKKVKGCTSEEAHDVIEDYNLLIDQSCKAVGFSASMTALLKNTKKEKTLSACLSEITNCIIGEKRCLTDYRNCESDADFDRHFSECSITYEGAQGCDEHISSIRSTLISARDSAIKNADLALQNLVASYQNNRQTKLADVRSACVDSSAKQDCIRRVCENNMRNKCDIQTTVGAVKWDDKGSPVVGEQERTLAEQLCAYFDTACSRLPVNFQRIDIPRISGISKGK